MPNGAASGDAGSSSAPRNERTPWGHAKAENETLTAPGEVIANLAG
jgi:hypothetical protein